MSKFDVLVEFLMQKRVLGELGYSVIASIGGAAHYMESYIKTGQFHIGKFGANIFVSCFSGLVFLHFAKSIGISVDAGAMLAGLGGFMGARTVEYVFNKIAPK